MININHIAANRRFGKWLILAGVFALSFAGGRYALGAVEADRARRAWAEVSAHQAVMSAKSAMVYDDKMSRAEGTAVARLVIQSIGLDEVVLEGTSDKTLNAGPGHISWSPLPGFLGNSIISAHRDRHFRNFDRLKVGDSITTELRSRTTTWVIVSRRVVDKDSRPLLRTSDTTLTLTTCWPIRLVGSAPDRLIVTAKPVRTIRKKRGENGH
jgi:sortase A